MTESKPRRIRMSATERRLQLISVGREVFAERGFEAASVEEIAQRAGVTKPIIYEHFRGKEGLFDVIVDREMDDLLTRVAAALATGTPRARTEQAADCFLRYIEESPDGFRMLLRGAPSLESSPSSFGNLISDVATRAEQLISSDFASRGFDPSLGPLYSRAVIGLIANVGQWWLETGTPSRPEVVAHIVNLVWNGIEGLEVTPRLSEPNGGR